MDLKELLGENYKEDITVEEINSLISAMKLADLSKGEYVAKGKLTEAENKLTNLKKEYGEYKASKQTEEEKKTEAENAEKQDGDVAIVKAKIAEGKYSYTSYVYDSVLDTEAEDTTHGWSAMDGNYSAANVFLNDKITLAGNYTSIGNYNKGKEIASKV